jgi:hypothetical protein
VGARNCSEGLEALSVQDRFPSLAGEGDSSWALDIAVKGYNPLTLLSGNKTTVAKKAGMSDACPYGPHLLTSR